MYTQIANWLSYTIFCILVLSNIPSVHIHASVVPDSIWHEINTTTDKDKKIASIRALIENDLEEESDLKKLLQIIDRLDLTAKEGIGLKLTAIQELDGKGFEKILLEELEQLQLKAIAESLPKSQAAILIETSEILNTLGSLPEAKEKLDQAANLQFEDAYTQNLLQKAYSFYFYKTGDYEEGLAAVEQAIQGFAELEPSIHVVESYLQKGRIMRAKGEKNLAKESYIKSESYALKHGYENSLGPVLNNLGNIEHISGNYPEALEYYMRSLEIKEENKNIRGMSMSHFNIAAIQMDMENKEEALKGFLKAIEIASDIGYRALEIACHQRIGSIFRQQEKFDKAVEHHQKGLEISVATKNKKGRVAGHYNLGEDYLTSLEYKSAYAQYLDALSLAKEIGHKQYISAILTGIAKIYLTQKKEDSATGLELKKSNRVDFSANEIENLLLQAHDMAETINDSENKREAYEALSLFYNLEGNSRNEAIFLKKYIAIKDSIYSKENADAVANWQTKYKTAQQELEISQLKSSQEIAELRNQKVQAGLLGSFFVVLLGGLLGFFLWKNKQERKAMEEREIFRSNLSSELHDDVGSILTGLAMQSELMELHVGEKNISQVQNMAKMSREAMEKMRDTVWAIDSRKDSYLDLKDRILDFGADILQPVDVDIHVDFGSLDASTMLRPDLRQAIYLIFKEAATNVVKYSNTKKVDCVITQSNKEIKLHIRDYGEADPDTIKTSGTGLSNIKLRTERLKGRFRHYVDNGFHIECKFPLH